MPEQLRPELTLEQLQLCGRPHLLWQAVPDRLRGCSKTWSPIVEQYVVMCDVEYAMYIHSADAVLFWSQLQPLLVARLLSLCGNQYFSAGFAADSWEESVIVISWNM